MYLMKPHIFSANMSRSRSPFKVKGQIKVKRHFCDKTLWGHCCFTNTAFLLTLIVLKTSLYTFANNVDPDQRAS